MDVGKVREQDAEALLANKFLFASKLAPTGLRQLVGCNERRELHQTYFNWLDKSDPTKAATLNIHQ